MKKIINYSLNILQNQKILSIILASFIYIMMLKTDILAPFDFTSWSIYLILILFINKIDLFDKKYIKSASIMSLIFGFLLLFGMIVYRFQDLQYSVWGELFTFRSLMKYLGYVSLVYIILITIIPKLIDFKTKHNKIKFANYQIFIFCFLLILLGWLPYFLGFYPGTISPDSIGEITQIENGFVSLSDHHPILHVLFMSGPYTLGKILFGTANAGIALTAVMQMVIMSAIFSSVIVFLKNRKASLLTLILTLTFFMLAPMHGYYSITMWKDVLFAGVFVLFTMQNVILYENYKKDNITIKSLILYGLVAILCLFFRNNAVYMFMVVAVLLCIILRKHYKKIIPMCVIIFAIFYIIKIPVFNALNISKSGSAEYIGMPLQQIGRMAYKNVDFTDEELDLLNKLIPVEIMAVGYNPRVSDGIKFNDAYNAEVFDENKFEYAQLWASLVVKHPGIALEAYANSTLGYWYPNIVYWSVSNIVWENELGIYMDSKLSEEAKTVLLDIENRMTPIINITWSIGLCFWIIALMIYTSIKRNGWDSCIIYLPTVGIWITMMVASPVFGEFRYVYCVFCALPLLIAMPFNKEK